MGEDAPAPDARTTHLPALAARALEALMQSLDSGAVAQSLSVNPALLGLLLSAQSYLGAAGTPALNVPAWLVDTMREMRKLPCAEQSVKNLVYLCGRTQEHVGRAMKKHYGMTPTEYINSLKLSEAARLLKTSDMSVLEIQLECGFESTSHFNQRFKREYATSPSHYRALNRVVIDPKRE